MKTYWLGLMLLVWSAPVWGMGSLPSQSEDDGHSLIGKPAPDAMLVKTDGTRDKVIAGNKGQQILLVFWATWCPNCREELETIKDKLGEFSQAGIKIVPVDVGETRQEASQYFNRHQVPLVSFVDEQNILQDPYHLIGIPTLVFIDAQGIVRQVTHELKELRVHPP